MNLWKWSSLLAVTFVFSLALAGAAPQGEKKDDKASPAKGDTQKKEAAKGDAAKGKQVFEDNCSICHNADSDEQKVGPGLKGLFHMPPHKMSDGTEHKTHTVEMIRKQIKEGSGAMPPIGAGLSDKEIEDVLAFLQTI